VIKSAVRGVAITALTTAFALLPTSAQAEGKDSDNDVEKLELTGISRSYTSHPPIRGIDSWMTRLERALSPGEVRVGDSWATRMDLYTVQKTGANKKQPQYAGDGESSCSVVHVDDARVTAQCTRVLRLKKGSLTLSDMIGYRPGERVTAKTAIVGGTGHYRSAYGDGYITLDGEHIRLQLNVDE
jgi:hypothetical protein